MNGEIRELRSVNRYADLNENLFGLPDAMGEEIEEERLEYRC